MYCYQELSLLTLGISWRFSETEQIIIEYSIDDGHELPLFGDPDPVIKITATNDSVRFRCLRSPSGTITASKGRSNEYLITLIERDFLSDCGELDRFERLVDGGEEIATKTWAIGSERKR